MLTLVDSGSLRVCGGGDKQGPLAPTESGLRGRAPFQCDLVALPIKCRGPFPHPLGLGRLSESAADMRLATSSSDSQNVPAAM